MRNRCNILIGSLAVVAMTQTIRAADASWSLGTGGGSWNNALAWTPAASPGLTSGSNTSADTATFDSSTRTVNSTIAVDAGRNIGNITFNTTNTFGYTLNGGSLVFSAGGAVLTTGSGTGQSNITTGMTLQGDYTFTANKNLQFNSTAATFTTAASLGAVTMNIGGSYATVLSTGIISQGTGSTLSIVKSGTGSWQFNGVNTFTGGVTVKEGFLGVGNTGGLGAGTLTLGDSSGSNNASAGFGSNVNPTNAINVASGSSGTLALQRTGGSGPSTLSGPITLANNLTISHNPGTSNGQNFTISGNLTGTGNVSVKSLNGTGTTTLSGSVDMIGALSNDSSLVSPTVISGVIGTNVTGVAQNSSTSTLTLSNTNAYTGGTTVTAGTLTLGHATNTLADTGAVAVSGGTLAIGANSDTVGAITLTGGSITGSTGTLTGSSYALQAGTVSAKLGGLGALTKSSSGTVTLSGVNSYTGATTVSAGKLVIDGNISTSMTTIEANGTLGGSGTLGALTVGSGGTLAPGSSAGTLTFTGDLTLSSGSVSDFEINTLSLGNYDLALATAAGTQTGTFNGGILNLFFQSGFSATGTVKIFDFDAYAGGGFSSVAATGLASGFAASFDATNGTVTVIPEPNTAALLGGFGTLALLRRRRA